MATIRMILLGTLILLAGAAPQAATDDVPGDERTCERGKGIERSLGMHGYRVVVSGGARGRENARVKVQIWQNECDDWVITERFLRERRTCVVRSGRRLHMMY